MAKLMWIIVLLCPMLPAASTAPIAVPAQTEHIQWCNHHGACHNVDLCTPPLREQRETPAESQTIESWQGKLTRSPKLRPIEEAISWFRESGILAGPWPKDRCTMAVCEQNRPNATPAATIRATHPDSNRRHLDPSIGFALAAQRMLRHRIIEYRSQIATDLDYHTKCRHVGTRRWSPQTGGNYYQYHPATSLLPMPSRYTKSDLTTRINSDVAITPR